MSATRSLDYDVKDISLAAHGKQRIEWAEREGMSCCHDCSTEIAHSRSFRTGKQF